jgi:hypothetical protein
MDGWESDESLSVSRVGDLGREAKVLVSWAL